MKTTKPTMFYVEYNAKFIAMYKSVRACLAFIDRKGLRDDFDNSLCIYDNLGNPYSWINGNRIN